MVDNRFFHNSGPLALHDIATLTGAVITTAPGESADTKRLFKDVAPLDRAGGDDISFLDNIKYVDSFVQTKAGACFVRPKYVERAPAGTVLLVTDEPYYAYALAARRFYADTAPQPGISPHAVISDTAIIGKNACIEPGVIIEGHVRIGDHCTIGANTVIGTGVEIGNHCKVGAVCTLSHAVLGQRVILHRGIHIGQDGFGFAPSRTQGIVKVPQLGRVVIGDDVEIGSGTCIDRGAGPDTIIGSGSKIDNLVQIGHNVHIGKYVIIAAQCGIAGSTHVGDGAMLGGQVGLSGHVRVGAGAKLAAQSGVMVDIPPGATYGGSPAVPVKDWHRQTVAVANLIKKRELSDD